MNIGGQKNIVFKIHFPSPFGDLVTLTCNFWEPCYLNFNILRFLCSWQIIQGLFSISGLTSKIYFSKMLNYGNPETKTTTFLSKVLIKRKIKKNIPKKSWGLRCQFLVHESNKNWVFKRAGEMILKTMSIASLESKYKYPTISFHSYNH